MNTYENNAAYARRQDAQDPLRHFREQFYIPPVKGREAIYFCGNSLGLQPKTAREAAELEFQSWQQLGVEGHFQGPHPWLHYHEYLSDQEARVVGARPPEVVVMNNLTTNLHLMLVSFYQPTPQRFKIITEAGAFPSDQYALETQVRFHGLDPDQVIVELSPRPGEHTLRPDDILASIREHGPQLALILMGGINYYTGQAFDMAAITRAGQDAGAFVGFDLAHAAGNMVLHLHDWQVDFAVWCTYKYMNSGPGGVAGTFVHEKHGQDATLPRFGGWWGHNKEERFQMRKGFKPMPGAAGWQLSNAAIFPMAIHKASLAIFDAATMPALRRKSELLTGYLEYLIHDIGAPAQVLEIITPADPQQRGCQLSLLVHRNGRGVFDSLTAAGVILDWREPNVIRVAPTPLYNTFEEVYRFGEALRESL